MTANSRVPMPPGGRSGTASVQIVPAGLPVAHDQPGELPPEVKRVATGTVSVRSTPVAVPLPMFSYSMV